MVEGPTPPHLIYLCSKGIVVHVVILSQLQLVFNTPLSLRNFIPNRAIQTAKLSAFDILLKYSAKNRKFYKAKHMILVFFKI